MERTLNKNIRATDKLPSEVNLGEGGPIGVLLHACAQLVVRQDIVALDLGGAHIGHVEGRDDAPAESAHGALQRALDEHDDRLSLNRRINRGPRLCGQVSHLRGGQGWAEHARRGGGGRGGESGRGRGACGQAGRACESECRAEGHGGVVGGEGEGVGSCGKSVCCCLYTGAPGAGCSL